MPQSVFNRYEKKYLMPERVYQELRGRLSPYMQVDSYGLHTWLQNAYPDKFEEYINRLSAYMETSGKHYANHYATIRKWLDEDSKPKPGNSYDYDYTYDKGECL